MFCKKYDVAVCGGGIAGCAAAIASAQRGMKTVLIENCVIPGGLATSGMVLVYLPLCDGEGRQVVSRTLRKVPENLKQVRSGGNSGGMAQRRQGKPAPGLFLAGILCAGAG